MIQEVYFKDYRRVTEPFAVFGKLTLGHHQSLEQLNGNTDPKIQLPTPYWSLEVRLRNRSFKTQRCDFFLCTLKFENP